MKFKTINIISAITFFLFFVLFFIGGASENMTLTYVSIAVLFAWGVFYLIVWRCPFCGRYLGHSKGPYCQHCGAYIKDKK